MPQQYLLLQARELCEDGEYFMIVQPLTREWLESVSLKIDLWHTVQKSTPDLDTLTFHDNLEFRADGTLMVPRLTGEGLDAMIASDLLVERETEYTLLDRDAVLPDPDSDVRGVSMVVDGEFVYWQGFQKHSEVSIESGGIPNRWFQEQLARLEATV